MNNKVTGGLDLGGNDVEAAFNLRDWLQSALEAKGAVITGSGMGFGGGDLWFTLDGVEFFTHIRPVVRKQGGEDE